MAYKTRYFVFYQNKIPMDTLHIDNGGKDFRPYHKEMCKILLEQGWTETDFITSNLAHSSIINSVVKPGDDVVYDARVWQRQGNEASRRREIAKTISYVDLIALAKSRVSKR